MSEEGNEVVPESHDKEKEGTPGKEFDAMFRALELRAHRGFSLNQGLDLSQFSREQIDKLIDLASKNEENASTYFNNKAQGNKELAIRRIDASIVDQKTFRYTIFGILFSVLSITGLILGLKPEYFGQWMTFLTGLAGGFGLGKIKSLQAKKDGNIDKDEDKE